MPYLTKLIEGYRRFREKDWASERERWAELAEGQSPQVMILACADSRSDPAQIFDARPGEMFVVRNIAALAPPYETSRGYHGVSSALEFAVTQLKVGEILVMGHGMCGGCAAALTGSFDDTPPGEGHFIADWVQNAGRSSRRSAVTPLRAGPQRVRRHGAASGQGQPCEPPDVPVDRGSRADGRAQAPRRPFLDRRRAPVRARRGGRSFHPA